MNKELEKVVENLIEQGITDEDEQVEIIMRDHSHLIPTPTKRELENFIVKTAILEANRESIAENGHPAIVCKRIDGVMKYRPYSTLSDAEIIALKSEGIIP